VRQVVLDTETTGLETSQGHRIIEIGCVEVENRRLTGRTYHQYIQPDREIDAGAQEVHGITADFLADKPVFEEIADEFMTFVDGAELVIHNAPFDMGFLDYELGLLKSDKGQMRDYCGVLDTLVMARNKHPGQRNNLDALCKRYDIDNSNRDLHGALLDAEILALVYLAMTGGQVTLGLDGESSSDNMESTGLHEFTRVDRQGLALSVIKASDTEMELHQTYLQRLREETGDAIWLSMES